MEDKKQKYFLTTPIYYVNDEPHIGHSYTTIAADVLARYKRLTGYDVFFLTGTDEHGQKIYKTAVEKGISPQELTDSVVVKFKSLWKKLDISYDRFIRTTEEFHMKKVQELWTVMQNKGDIYLGYYEGWYCVYCETFYLENQLINKKCPDCGREPSILNQESYFFKLSKYQDKLLEYFEKNKSFVLPAERRNEVLSFIKSGLKDISISRINLEWGIPVPGDNKHTIYVWFDALFNYLTGSYFNGKNYWPASLHLMAKDIIKFHAVYWPAFLLSCEEELPHRVFSHGWWTVEGEKMSKSKNNFIKSEQIIEKYDVNTFRYLLFRGIVFGNDSDFSWALLKEKYNADLANSIGNFVSRVLTMCIKYIGDKIYVSDFSLDEKFSIFFDKLFNKYNEMIDEQNLSGCMDIIFSSMDVFNKYIVEKEPWKMFKTDPEKTKIVLYNLIYCLKNISFFIYPFMPDCATTILDSIGLNIDLNKYVLDSEKINNKELNIKIKGVPHLFERK